MDTHLTPAQEQEAKELEARIRQAMEKEIATLARLMVGKPDRELFGKTEFQVRDILLRVGAKVYEEHLREKKNGYQGSGVTCPHCGQTAEFQGYRRLRPLSILGPICFRRAYYYCHRCGGLTPWDQEVGLTAKRLTPAAEELTTLAGTLCNSFEEAAAKALPKLAALRLSESTVQRTSEAAGQRLDQLLLEKKVLGGPTPWDWHKDARGRTCAYASIDATGVRQQAFGGGAAEGRMPYVAMIFNPVPDLPLGHPHRPPVRTTMQARYLAGLYDLDELGLQLRRQGGQVGMNRAEQWIGLTDGGNGLESFLRKNFPRDLVLILDFWHVTEYLGELSKALYPIDEDRRQSLMTSWCHTLKHEGGQALLGELEKLELPPRKPAVREQYEVTLGYVRSNLHRMDYPTYLANGWCIGSGSVESACKTVVGQRLKLAGMRWREPGTNDMCHLRALFRSETTQWDLFWSRSVN